MLLEALVESEALNN